MSVIELPRLGPPAHERHARMIDLFGELLSAGLRETDEPPRNVDTMVLCIGGSVWETVRRHAAERRLHRAPRRAAVDQLRLRQHVLWAR